MAVVWLVRIIISITLIISIVIALSVNSYSVDDCSNNITMKSIGSSMGYYTNDTRYYTYNLAWTWNSLEVGNVIAFENDLSRTGFTRHRIIYKNKYKLITKGDANSHNDKPLYKYTSNIIGVQC